MQAPDTYDRDDEDHKIAEDVDDAGADEDGVLVYALAACGYDSCFANALGCDGDDEGDGVEDVDPETEPYCPPDRSAAGTFRGKEALVEEEERDFGETHADSGDDLGVLEMLEQGISCHFYHPS